jgi:phosphoglycolate phosphatase
MPTIILDLDGPLLDGRYRHHACYRRILTDHGHRVLDLAEYWEMKRQRLDRRAQLAATGAEALYDTFLASWLALIETPELLALDRLHDGVLPKLDDWRRRGFRLLLATQRHNALGLLAQLADLGLWDFFAHVVGCDHAEGGVGKARRVRDRVADDDQRLWVGDTEVDVDAARTLGCPVWAVSCGIRTEAYLQSLAPDFLSASLNDIDLHGLWA